MFVKSRAVVLNALKYGDNQLIVDMLTEQTGRLSFLLNMPKTARGKLKRQLFQPLTLLMIEFDHRQQARLQRLRDVRLEMPYVSVPFDAGKLSLALFLSEFLTYATRGEQRNEALFGYVSSSLQWLDATSRPAANFHLVFLMRLSQFIGFYPNLEGYREGSFFDLRSAEFSSSQPLHSDFVEPGEAAYIERLMRMHYETMHLFLFTRAQRNRILDHLIAYYRLHVPSFPELRSLPVVQELFV
ncbi:MAG: DNA repair protein RecO C-terminal domain-containing protein [Prevotella sp.]|nr:DNA repair protein RecO C-terminal domain-containing protein [Prevotella sp.]